MSLENQDKIPNDNVDSKECQENVSVSETISDSGVSNIESSSTAYRIYSDISPSKSSEGTDRVNVLGVTENDVDSMPSSPVSLSPVGNELIHDTSSNKDNNNIECSTTSSTEFTDSNKNDDDQIKNDSLVCLKTEKIDSETNESTIICLNSALTTSTVSLNEHTTCNNENITRHSYSRSVENISNMDLDKLETNLSNKNINAEKVLLEFDKQKNVVTATQKIPEQPQTNADTRYAKLPKELIPQDLGSIAKNVHGIFSTVSGSLKNAYNNSYRISMQKVPVKSVTKPLPNGKVMNYIFETETIEETPVEKSASREKESVDESNKENFGTVLELDGEIDSENTKDLLKIQVESLERLLAEQRKENNSLKERLKQQSDESQEKDQLLKDLESKMDLMSKRAEQAEREKDAAVMRYASVECAGIEARRAADRAAAAERAAVAEAELLSNKLKSAHGEKQRICHLYDDKCHELTNSERELSKIREEMREVEGRLKWTQSKLRMEMDAYKESAERAEKLSQQVTELEAAKDAAANSAVDSIRAKHLESELKESQAALILVRHEKQELDKRLSVTSQQLDGCVRERDSANAALVSARAQVEQLQISNLRLEEEAAELAALRAQAALADTLTAQLHRETERSALAEAALAEARAQAETCARREAAALEHAARLTADHVQQRNSARATKDQVQALTADNTSLRERVSALESERDDLNASLATEADRRTRENKVLARKVAELTEEVSDANKKLEWEKGENGVLKKKHASAVKELNRELQRALKRCDQLEAKLPPPDAASTRTGSVSSLSSSESAAQEERLQNGHVDVPEIQAREPSRQVLIERIVSLQREAARRADRCEFLEEHSRQLTGELRNKARLLRHLLCAMPAGAVASRDRDANKKEIARLGGGAMAAVYGGDPGGITLELSLEMNKRLQAVLEDALLNNITLKENMETLGTEISRLKETQRAEKGQPN